MEDIRRILNIPEGNLSREDHIRVWRFLSYRDNFFVGNEFNEALYEQLQDIYYDYLD